jgi:hypothetical protein
MKYIVNYVTSNIFFLVEKFGHWQQKKMFVISTKDFQGKNPPNFPYLNENELNSSYLDYRFLQVTNTYQGFKNIYFFSLTYNQSWLSPLVEDCRSTYLMKLGKKTMFTSPTSRGC